MRAPQARAICEGKQKTRPDCRPIRPLIHNRVRAAHFSDLFNVVASRPAKSPRRIDWEYRYAGGNVKWRPCCNEAARDTGQAFAFPSRPLYHWPRLAIRLHPAGRTQ
jgi:hypothetical protein